MSNAPFVDIHCHLLPGIDDGPPDWEESLAMARMAAADGMGTAIVTPHQLGGFPQNTGDVVRRLTAELQQLLKAERIPLRVLPGADVRIETDLVSMIRAGDVLTLGDHRRHVLLELPHELYVPLERLLAELAAAGVVGILSHPERNLGILDKPSLVPRLIDAGCLMQLTAGSLLGAFGARIQAFSESLVEQRLVQFVGTDAHGTRARRPLLRRAFDRIAELAGAETALNLCCRNPACVADGKDVTLGLPRSTKLSNWLRGRRAG